MLGRRMAGCKQNVPVVRLAEPLSPSSLCSSLFLSFTLWSPSIHGISPVFHNSTQDPTCEYTGHTPSPHIHSRLLKMNSSVALRWSTAHQQHLNMTVHFTVHQYLQTCLTINSLECPLWPTQLSTDTVNTQTALMDSREEQMHWQQIRADINNVLYNQTLKRNICSMATHSDRATSSSRGFFWTNCF